MRDDVPFDVPEDAYREALLEGLNDGQREAVLATGAPVLILAGAGSGKTRAITHKIGWLTAQEGYRPWEILAVTFTNRAAREMRDRVRLLLGEDVARDVRLGTFHSTCVRILRAHGGLLGYRSSFVIYDDSDQMALVTRILKESKISERSLPPRRFLSFIDHAKNEGLAPRDRRLPQEGQFERVAGEVYAEYQRRLMGSNAVDFGDLLLQVTTLFERAPEVLSEYRYRWRYVLVDEFQDTNAVQYKLLRQLVGERGALCVVGDDDQSIYRWRGARVENILRFAEHFPGTAVVRLERNYRSSAKILAAAGSVISHNTARHEKRLWTERPPGDSVVLHTALTERDEADWIASRIVGLRLQLPLREIAVFYRTNAMSRVIEDALRSIRIPYRVVGGLRFYDRAEVKDLLAYLKLLVNPADEVSLARVVNVPARGIGPGTYEKVLARAAQDGSTALEALFRLAGTDGPTGKRLLGFRELMEKLQPVAKTADAATVANRVLEHTGYWQMLKAEASVEAEARMDNLRELLASIEEFQEGARDRDEPFDLGSYLDQVTLTASVDEQTGQPDAVTLMTVHSAKGLEFDAVLLAGIEEQVLPHFNSLASEEAVEEERRLCYVAMTRARHHLFLSWARSRRRFGSFQESEPSRFLRELPKDILTTGDRGHSLHRPALSMPRMPPLPRAVPDRRIETLEDGRVLDRNFDQTDSDEPAPGTRVRHPRFGVGTIRSIQGSGPDARVAVAFPGVGEKTIVARFLARA